MEVTTLSLHQKTGCDCLSPSQIEELLVEEQQQIIQLALAVIEQHWYSSREVIDSPAKSIDYFRLQLANQKQEIFSVLFLDNKNQVINFEPLFRGTIDGASVYPRVVAQRALEQNAAAIIVGHNHPSGVAEPSHADIRMTQHLYKALDLIDIKLLDHLIIGRSEAVSLAERSLLTG